MSLAQSMSTQPTGPILGGSEFLTPPCRSERCHELAEQGYLVARVAPPEGTTCMSAGPLSVGKLRESLEGAVEISLALRGALPPSVGTEAWPEDMAADQMFRIRNLGATGLCIVLPPLRLLADEDGLLAANDSVTLGAWKELSERAPVVLLFDDEDRELSMLAPASLGGIFESERPSWPQDERSVEEAEPAVLETLVDLEEEEENDEVDLERHQGWHRDSVELLEALTAPDDEDNLEEEIEGKLDDEIANEIDEDEIEGETDEVEPEEPASPAQGSLFAEMRGTPKLLEPPPRKRPVMQPEKVIEHSNALFEAQGPRPVSHIEDLFRDHYAPLLRALMSGLDEAQAEEAVADWRASFSHSYAESYTHMRLTGKRPNMVLDAPDLAAKIGRLNGARSVQLLLVDSQRFDLGEIIRDQLKDAIGNHAVCVHQELLWSALPTITPTQMRLLARGARGLREPEPQSERDPAIHRAGSVTTLRRVRIGQRDLLKLDVVEARLREAGPDFNTRMDAVADEATKVIAHFTESLAPRTLLYVFGDHGFTMDRTGGRTSPANQGGTSPEEVLVGAYAWMIGDVH